jgi:hypothetical protein
MAARAVEARRRETGTATVLVLTRGRGQVSG